MGEVLSFRRIQIAVLAAIAAFALGFSLTVAQSAYADEGQYQAGALAVQKNAAAVEQPTAIESGKAVADSKNAATYTLVDKNAGTVAYKAPVKKSAKSVKVPNTVTIDGKVYKVTKIAANAFKGSKAKTVTLGTNITKISKNAFKGAKKLKTLKINSKKLTKKGVKGSLKGSKIKTVKVPKAKVKAYKKYFKKSNSGKKVTVKKK